MCRSTDSRRRARCWAAALALLVPAGALAQRWQQLGPDPISSPIYTGRTSALALSASRANRYWVGEASGGAWFSKNGGGRWRPRTDDLPGLAIGALALDPSDEKILYAGSGEANFAYHSLYGLGLYKSTDRGRSWEILAATTFAGRTFSQLVVSPADGRVVWAAVSRAGGTFLGKEGARRHPARGGKTGIFRSLDGGASWKRLRKKAPGIPASDVDLDPSNPQRVFASFGHVFGHKKNGVYRSTDGGRRWKRLPIGLDGREIGRIALAVAPSNPDRIYALVARPAGRETTGGSTPAGADTLGLLRSSDGGDSWSRLDPGNPQPSFGHYYAAIAVHPTEADTLVVGGLELQLSEDAGASWSVVTPPHVDVHDAAFDAAGRLVVATDGGVYRSTNLGRGWVSRNGRLGGVQFYPGLAIHPSDPEVLLGGTQDNGSSRRLPDGRWQVVLGGDGGWCLIRPDDPSILFVEFQGVGNLYRSTNAGDTVARVGGAISAGDRTAFQAPVILDPLAPTHMFYATQRIWESSDGGTSWTAVSDDLVGPPWAIRSLAAAPSDPDVLYAVTSDGGVHVSGDGGRGWTRTLDDLAGWPRIQRQIAVDPADPAVAYLAEMRFGGRKVLETTDRGATWASIAGDLPDVPVNAVAVAGNGPDRRVFAATDRGVWVTADRGASWRRYGEGLPNASAIDVVVDAAHDRLVVATLGRGIWTAPLPAAAAD